MPKSAKKRKDKAADFSKAKLKLGKGKQQPTNAIDTSFKARSIALPSQSIAQTKDRDEPLTNRRLGLNDLLGQLKHYSSGVRKDAISGLRELFGAFPSLMNNSLPLVFANSARLMSDEDTSVRRNLLVFYTWLLPQFTTETLLPHAQTLLLFATAAQTHIFPEIRIESLKFINVFLEYIPSAVIAGWDRTTTGHGSRIIDGYLAMFNAGTRSETKKDGSLEATSTASVILSPQSRLAIYESLSLFLSKALDKSKPSETNGQLHLDFWYMEPLFHKLDAFESFIHIIRPNSEKPSCSLQWTEHAEAPACSLVSNRVFSSLEFTSDIPDILQSLQESQKSSSPSSISLSALEVTEALTHALQGTLISALLDVAPSVSQNPSETDVKTLLTVSRIYTTLYSGIFRLRGSLKKEASTTSNLAMVVKHLSAYFPFHLRPGQDQFEGELQELNLAFCQLSAMHFLRSTSNGRHLLPSSQASTSMKSVTEFMSKLLSNKTSALERSITPAAYLACLPTLWTLVLDETISRRKRQETPTLFELVVRHATELGSKAFLKQPATEFICHLVLLDTEEQSQPIPNLLTDPNHAKCLKEWFTHLPKVLWEIDTYNSYLTEIILRFLLRAFQRRSSVLTSKITREMVMSRLNPYFSIKHPTRGVILGPYARLHDPFVRRLALDVVREILSEFGSSTELAHSVNRAVVHDTEGRLYWDSCLSSLCV